MRAGPHHGRCCTDPDGGAEGWKAPCSMVPPCASPLLPTAWGTSHPTLLCGFPSPPHSDTQWPVVVLHAVFSQGSCDTCWSGCAVHPPSPPSLPQQKLLVHPTASQQGPVIPFFLLPSSVSHQGVGGGDL